MISNPGKTVTVDNVAQFAIDAFYDGFNMKNITSGFKYTEIWQINKNIFSDEDSLPAFVTDQAQSVKTAIDSDENLGKLLSNEKELPHSNPKLDSNMQTLLSSILCVYI